MELQERQCDWNSARRVERKEKDLTKNETENEFLMTRDKKKRSSDLKEAKEAQKPG